MFNGNFSLILTENGIVHQKDIEHLRTKSWVVPGEKCVVLIKAELISGSFDSFSYNCMLIDFNRMSLSQIENTNTEGNDVIIHKKVTINPSVFTVSPFRTNEKTLYCPVKITIPMTKDKEVTFGAFISNPKKPDAILKCKVLNPFTITKSLFSMPQNYIIAFKAKVSLDEELKDPATLLSTELKFNEKQASSFDVLSNISIISQCQQSTQISKGDEFSFVFTIKPLNETGALALTNLPLVLKVQFKIANIEFSFFYPFSTRNYCNPICIHNCSDASAILKDIIIAAPNVNCTVLQKTTIPITITNTKYEEQPDPNYEIKLNFKGKGIKPDIDSVTFKKSELAQQKVINLTFIPLVCGTFEFNIEANVVLPHDDKKVKCQQSEEEQQLTYKTLFPIYINIAKPNLT